jgi:uncharacterized lipoprotein YmbA
MIRMSKWAIAFGVVIMMAFSGCRSAAPPVTYYTLDPIAEFAPETMVGNDRGTIIGIRPVDLPGTINRLQMVTRSGAHKIAVSSQHRWADYPNQLVQQTIGENLQALMPATRVVSAPWPIGLKPDITVTVKFYELIGTADSQVLLSVLWIITTADPTLTYSHRLRLMEPITGKGYDELVAAHSRVLAALCREMANSLKAFGG